MSHRKDSDRYIDLKSDELFADDVFPWHVRAAGYQLGTLGYRPFGAMNAPEETGLLLADMTPYDVRPQTPYRVYAPMRESGLFRIFADLPPSDRDAIRLFADKYGLLGVPVVVFLPEAVPNRAGIRVPPLADGTPRIAGRGELLTLWQNAIGDMHRAVKLWLLVTESDEVGLRSQVRYHGGSFTYKWRGDSGFFQTTIPAPSGVPVKSDDVITPARFLIQHWINKAIMEHVSPRLLWNIERGSQVLRILPKNLLGAMWFQFARAVAGEVSYRACKACGKVLTISTEKDGGRNHREFCNVACRQKDHRRKVREANELKVAGKTVRQIAKHFNTKPETIKNWLTTEK